jgi:hypothetical protein
MWKTEEVKLHEMNVSDTLFISTELALVDNQHQQTQRTAHWLQKHRIIPPSLEVASKK